MDIAKTIQELKDAGFEPDAITRAIRKVYGWKYRAIDDDTTLSFASILFASEYEQATGVEPNDAAWAKFDTWIDEEFHGDSSGFYGSFARGKANDEIEDFAQTFVEPDAATGFSRFAEVITEDLRVMNDEILDTLRNGQGELLTPEQLVTMEGWDAPVSGAREDLTRPEPFICYKEEYDVPNPTWTGLAELIRKRQSHKASVAAANAGK